MFRIIVSTVIVAILLATSTGKAQTTTYSESIPYEPRKDPWPEKKKGSGDQVAASAERISSFTSGKPVTMPVSVLDKENKPVTGLKKSDFTLFLNDSEVEITTVTDVPQPVNVILLLDASPSADPQLKDIQKDAIQLVNQLPPDAKIMVAQFNEQLRILTDFTNDRTKILEGIAKCKLGDGTSLYSVVNFIYDRIAPDIEGAKVMFLFSDGMDTTSHPSTFSDSLARAEEGDITVFPVYIETSSNQQWQTVGSSGVLAQILARGSVPSDPANLRPDPKKQAEIGKLYLTDLASLSGGRVLDPPKKKNVWASISGEANQRYYVTFMMPKPNSTRREQIKIRIKRPDLTVHARGSIVL